MARLELLVVLVSVTPCLSEDQLSQNIVTEEVRTELIKTKYGRVQGFVSRVGRDASSARYVEIYLGLPYASPPTANYRYLSQSNITGWEEQEERIFKIILKIFCNENYNTVCTSYKKFLVEIV